MPSNYNGPNLNEIEGLCEQIKISQGPRTYTLQLSIQVETNMEVPGINENLETLVARIF